MCQHPVDMRKGINGLYKLVRSEMKMSPLTGCVFIFYGKNHQSIKLLYRMPWKTFSLIMQGVSLRSARYRKRFKIEV